jgi:uncharacterized membrane protein
LGNKLADLITEFMGTWKFVFIFLAGCAAELITNHYGWVHFDPSTFILNLGLSLMAAIQGSIIMISQKMAESKRDQMLQMILESSQRILDLEEHILEIKENTKTNTIS